MTIVKQITDGAAKEIGVKKAEMDLESDDFETILESLNDMLTEWADIGLTPAFTEVVDSSDTVKVDRNAVAAIKFNLAIRIASSFQRIVTTDLANNARDTLNRLRASVTNINVQLPDTLPVGTGNDCGNIFTEDRFFLSNDGENF